MRSECINNHKEWDEKLGNIEKYINHTPSLVTNVAPVTLMKKIQPERPWNIDNINIENLQEKAKRNIMKYNEKYEKKENKKIKKQIKFNIGDKVLLKRHRVSNKRNETCAKLQEPYIGPFIIKRLLGNNVYELLEPETQKNVGKYHIQLLYKYYEENENETKKKHKKG